MWKYKTNATVRCGRNVAAAAGIATAVLLAVSPAVAAERHLTMKFDAYVGGISALSVGVDAGLRPDAYNVDFRFGTEGIVSWVVDWKMNAFSRGEVRHGLLVPASASTNSLWDGDRRTTRLAYRKDGSVAAVIEPPPSSDNRSPVPDAMKRGTVDISSALLGTLEAIGRTGKCARRVKVYDGKHRYDLVVQDGGKTTLGPDSDSVYHGPALICRLSIDPKAGYGKGGSQMDWATGDYAKVYVAKVFSNGPPIPVALEYGTTLGELRAYLTDARLTDGELTERLSKEPLKAADSRSNTTAKEDVAKAASPNPQ